VNYQAIEDAVYDAIDYAEGGRGGMSVSFQLVTEDLLDGVQNRLNQSDWEYILRYHRLNSWMNMRGEEKEVMDNLLGRILDLVTFG